MRLWATEFQAIDFLTGELKTYVGDNIEAPSWDLAQEWCIRNAGHLGVVGELISEIDEDTDERIDYDLPQLN